MSSTLIKSKNELPYFEIDETEHARFINNIEYKLSTTAFDDNEAVSNSQLQKLTIDKDLVIENHIKHIQFLKDELIKYKSENAQFLQSLQIAQSEMMALKKSMNQLEVDSKTQVFKLKIDKENVEKLFEKTLKNETQKFQSELQKNITENNLLSAEKHLVDLEVNELNKDLKILNEDLIRVQEALSQTEQNRIHLEAFNKELGRKLEETTEMFEAVEKYNYSIEASLNLTKKQLDVTLESYQRGQKEILELKSKVEIGQLQQLEFIKVIERKELEFKNKN